jgi:hypothetical protein
MSDPILALHNELFGFIPKKAGTAYERVAAMVLATLGWENIQHDVTEQPVGRLAEHQLDVTAQDPSGKVERLVVECKQWETIVGEEVLNTLVGVVKQVGGAAAVVTTQGYTVGARAVAVDEDIALLRLRHFDPEHEKGNFVMKVILTIDALLPSISDFDVQIAPSAVGLPTELHFALSETDHLRHLDGGTAETLGELLESQSSALEGRHHRRVDFAKGRLIDTVEGPPVPIIAAMWVEENVRQTQRIETSVKGTPVLVVEQLDQEGNVHSGRLVVSSSLYAWDIGAGGQVQPRGRLTSEDRQSE